MHQAINTICTSFYLFMEFMKQASFGTKIRSPRYSPLVFMCVLLNSADFSIPLVGQIFPSM